MSGNNRTGKLFVLFTEDVLWELNCSIEWLFCQSLLNCLLDVEGFLVFSLLLEGGNEGTSFYYFSWSELAIFMKDCGITQLKSIPNFFQVDIGAFPFFPLLSILRKNIIHPLQFIFSYRCSNLPPLFTIIIINTPTLIAYSLHDDIRVI